MSAIWLPHRELYRRQFELIRPRGFLPGWNGGLLVAGAAAAPSSIVTFRGVIDPGDSVGIGTAEAGRLVVVCPHHLRTTAPGRSISSVTIDGSGGTIHAQVGANANSGAGVGIASRVVAAGTSIVITWALSGTVLAGNNVASVYTVTGLASSTPHDAGTANGDNPTAQLDLPANGVLIAACVSTATGGAITWTGATEDGQSTMSNAEQSSAHSVPTSSTSNHSVSVSSGGANEVIAAASWA